MCEPPFTACASKDISQPIESSTLPLTQESCRGPPSPLSEFARQVQFELTQRAKFNAMQKKESDTQCDLNAQCTLQLLPDYHNIDLNQKSELEKKAPEQRGNLGDPYIAKDCDLTCAGPRFQTFRIEKEPGSDPGEPMVVDETYPGLAVYIKQIVKSNSTRNAIYGIHFEPWYASAKSSKKNPYEILYPSVIENLLNKLISSSFLSPEDLEMISKFINILGRLNIKDTDAYFRMLRKRGVVLADVIEHFRKQFWQLKSVILSKKDVANFLKNVKHAVLFGDPEEEKQRRAKWAKQLEKALEVALQQAEQWAKELLSKKITWSSGKVAANQMAKDESKTEARPGAQTSIKPAQPSTQKEAGKPTETTGKFDATKQLIIRKDTDPKFQLKKDDPATLEETRSKKDLLSKEVKETAAKKDDGTQKTHGGTEHKTAQTTHGKKDAASVQKSKAKKERRNSHSKTAAQDETTVGVSLTKKDTTPHENVGKKDEPSMQKGPGKQESSPTTHTPITKRDETPTSKDGRGRETTTRQPAQTGQTATPKTMIQDSSKGTSQEPSSRKGDIISNTVNILIDANKRKRGDAGKRESKPLEQPKMDFFRNEPLDPHIDASDKVSTRSMRMVREPERDFRMRLAAALSAAQKYADKTLYIPDPHGVDDTPRGTKRFTSTDIFEADGKTVLRRSPSKVYNDSSQLFERFSFLTTGAHQQGYYEPWDVEFPWPDLQELVVAMARFYVKRMPDPNFSYRRGMEYYQAMFRRELEDSHTHAHAGTGKKTRKD